MKKIMDCRRSIIGLIAIGCLTYLGTLGMDVAISIAGIVASIAASNAYGEKTNG